MKKYEKKSDVKVLLVYGVLGIYLVVLLIFLLGDILEKIGGKNIVFDFLEMKEYL